MAIIALIALDPLLLPIGLILAIVVLVRSKDGKNHGKGLAIAAWSSRSLFSIVASRRAPTRLTQVDWDNFAAVEQLKAGECFNASNLTDDSEALRRRHHEVSRAPTRTTPRCWSPRR